MCARSYQAVRLAVRRVNPLLVRIDRIDDVSLSTSP